MVERLDTRVDFTRPDDDEPDSFDLWDSGGELSQADSDEVEAILARIDPTPRQKVPVGPCRSPHRCYPRSTREEDDGRARETVSMCVWAVV